MSAETPSFTESFAALPQRVAALIELLTTLDLRVRAALEGLEDMRRSVAPLESIGDKGDDLLADINQRSAALDERLHRDLDDLKAELMAKLGELDLGAFGDRFDRLEAAIHNIERATVDLDQNFKAGMEALPDFVTKRMKPTP